MSLAPSVDNNFLKMMKLVRDDIMCVWNNMIDRFQIIQKDRRTGTVRIILTVEEDDGSFAHPDQRTILFLSNRVDWEFMDKYPNANDMMAYFMKMKDLKKKKKAELRTEYRKAWIKENKRRIKDAMNLFRDKGILWLPEKKEKKIIVNF